MTGLVLVRPVKVSCEQAWQAEAGLYLAVFGAARQVRFRRGLATWHVNKLRIG